MTADLVQWLTAQLDEDERIAWAAADELGGLSLGDEWRYDGHYVETIPERDMVAVGSQDFMEPGVGMHIAAHDPARVLREVEMKRSLVAAHERVPMSKGDTADCAHCWGAVWPCPTLRLLASVYGDRPGYQESWRP